MKCHTVVVGWDLRRIESTVVGIFLYFDFAFRMCFLLIFLYLCIEDFRFPFFLKLLVLVVLHIGCCLVYTLISDLRIDGSTLLKVMASRGMPSLSEAKAKRS